MLMNQGTCAVTEGMELKLSVVLTRLLEERRVTLKQVAAATKIKPSTLSGWKGGVSPRDLGEVRVCARYFGVSMEKMLFDETQENLFLEELLTEGVFDGFLKVKIERVIPKKGSK